MTDATQSRLDRFIRRIWIAFALLVIAVGFAGWGWVRRTNDRVELGQRGICERLQIVRTNTNRNGLVLYEAIEASARSARLQAARAELLRLRSIPRYQAPVDCDEVIERPTTYQPPRPVQIESLTPAQRQGILENGARHHP